MRCVDCRLNGPTHINTHTHTHKGLDSNKEILPILDCISEIKWVHKKQLKRQEPCAACPSMACLPPIPYPLPICLWVSESKGYIEMKCVFGSGNFKLNQKSGSERTGRGPQKEDGADE